MNVLLLLLLSNLPLSRTCPNSVVYFDGIKPLLSTHHIMFSHVTCAFNLVLVSFLSHCCYLLHLFAISLQLHAFQKVSKILVKQSKFCYY